MGRSFSINVCVFECKCVCMWIYDCSWSLVVLSETLCECDGQDSKSLSAEVSV